MAPIPTYLPASDLKTQLPAVAVYLNGQYSHPYTVYFRPMPTRMEDLPWSEEFMRTKYTLGPVSVLETVCRDTVNDLNVHS